MNEKEKKIGLSIVMAVRNKKDLIERTLSSFDKMTDEVELIVIDDESDDGTSDIFNKEKYKWINYERLDNRMSTGYCRNIGMSKARGEYIGFIDGDDFMYLDRMVDLLRVAKRQDVDVACGYHRHYDLVNEIVGDMLLGINIDMDDKYYEKLPDFNANTNLLCSVSGTCWNKMFRTDFIRKNNIKFTDASYCEDRAFVLASLIKSNKSICVKECVYLYTEPTSNYSSTCFNKNIANGLWKEFFKEVDYLIGVIDSVREDNRKNAYYALMVEIILSARYIRVNIHNNDTKMFDRMFEGRMNVILNKI